MHGAEAPAMVGQVTDHYDVIIVGSGAGGGTLAHTLAPSGKRILLLERGDFLPKETGNWDPGVVFADGRYVSPDTTCTSSTPASSRALAP
jgi:choline dehydrogenase-like flavoprotein